MSTRRRADRVTAIMEQLSSAGAADVAALAERFRVSGATIRRDLQSLEDQRLLRRTHGGARAADLAHELPVRYRIGQHREAKLAIARAAVALLPHGPLVLGLSGGTTTHAVARLLAERFELTVVTNALNVAAEVALRPRLKLVMTGGVARSQSYELVGPLAERSLAALNLQVAIVGVDGISARAGLTTHDEIEAQTNATMIRQAERVIVVADGSKIGRVELAGICPVDAVREVVTDATADPAAVTALRDAGTTVHVVP